MPMNDNRFQKKLEKIRKKGERQKQKAELEAEYAEYYPHKRRKVSNIMLVVVVTAIVLYTAANLVVTLITGTAVDSTLTTCFYAFWSSELIALTTLKASKIIKGTDNDKKDDDVPHEEVIEDVEDEADG